MKKRNLQTMLLSGVLIILIAAVVLFAAGKPAWNQKSIQIPETLRDNAAAGTFSCFTDDNQGNCLLGYYAQTEDIWYLFVTSTQSVADVNLYYTGKIVASSSGSLDTETSVVKGAFQSSEDGVELTGEDGSVYHVVVLQSQLPSVVINLENTSLEQIHQDKAAKFEGNSISIRDPEKRYHFSTKNTMQITGRGNSSWREYEKKGYQIRFTSEVSLLGMERAKKWVLIANAGDETLMRNKLVYDMVADLDMAFAPRFEFVDLWIDGTYLGNYILGEKVELEPSRLHLKDNSGILFEHDEAFYQEETYWFQNKMTGKHFTVKASNIEDDALIQSGMMTFADQMDEFMEYLYKTSPEQITLEDLSRWIDVDSFAKYYLINDYTLNCEAYATSFYWYKGSETDVIHLGPVWDFDTCMGVDGRSNSENYGAKHVVFQYLLAIPEFRERTQQIYDQYANAFASMTSQVDVLQDAIADSARMNNARWNLRGSVNPKTGIAYAADFGTAVQTLRAWLEGRAQNFRIESCNVINSEITEDYTQMILRYNDHGNHDSLVFAVWSKKDGGDDQRWYMAERNAQGVWEATADLRNHRCDGIYYVSAYTDEEEVLVASGRNYSAQIRAHYNIEGKVQQNNQTLRIKMSDLDPSLSSVDFYIWGESAGQEQTLTKVEAKRSTDGYWVAETAACQFQLNAIDYLSIHAYGTSPYGERYLNGTSVHVWAAMPHTLPEDGSMTCTKCGKLVTTSEMETLSTPLYRLANPTTAGHIYTINLEERDQLTDQGWKLEGIAGYVPVYQGTPVYQLFDPQTGDRIYSKDQTVIASRVDEGWELEGVCWNSAEDGVPMYEFYDPKAKVRRHFYTANETERDALIANGWVFEGIAWYGKSLEDVRGVA